MQSEEAEAAEPLRRRRPPFRGTNARGEHSALARQTYAVLAFSGSRSPKAVKARQGQLAMAVGESAWRASGEPQGWFYDPPWTVPFLRLNEVAVQVERR